MIHVVFRHIAAVEIDGFKMGESSAPVVNAKGQPIAYPDQRAAVQAAEHMERENRRLGSAYAFNLSFTAGWIGEWKDEERGS